MWPRLIWRGWNHIGEVRAFLIKASMWPRPDLAQDGGWGRSEGTGRRNASMWPRLICADGLHDSLLSPLEK